MDFNEKASVYERISTSQRRAAEHLASLLTFINDGDTVLDVGCGTGYFTELLHKKTTHVEGIDIAEKMIKTALELRPFIKFSIANGEEYASEKSFSLITTNSVTYYFKDLLGTFKRFYNLLNQNGVYALQAQTIVTPEFSIAINNLHHNAVTEDIFSSFKMPTNQLEQYEYESLIQAAGFEIFHSEEISYRTKVSIDEALDVFKSGTATPLLDQKAYGKQLTDHYIREFWSVIRSGIEKQASSSSEVTLTIPRTYILARKP
ncbi:methyltransferase domain-containing protein [Chromobacterium sp. IIBBL 290-4]|uniref:methyltransferase domain-containing protein n=1 Tax=Chromobacterium sp. IIBBL 290-4 TaxID=2953890 RepID=UPI0020B8EC23|nr:methyltransferase domain-containing protein [Chromobacterium sp. IIBBL 290-4]UTH74157.1 methyltransferase domain-containing protein [Chromobacterium sp. IIBBL 290-4]